MRNVALEEEACGVIVGAVAVRKEDIAKGETLAMVLLAVEDDVKLDDFAMGREIGIRDFSLGIGDFCLEEEFRNFELKDEFCVFEGFNLCLAWDLDFYFVASGILQEMELERFNLYQEINFW